MLFLQLLRHASNGVMVRKTLLAVLLTGKVAFIGSDLELVVEIVDRYFDLSGCKHGEALSARDVSA